MYLLKAFLDNSGLRAHEMNAFEKRLHDPAVQVRIGRDEFLRGDEPDMLDRNIHLRHVGEKIFMPPATACL